MPRLSSADRTVSPPVIEVPDDYNAAHDLIERNLQAGRAGKVAFIDDAGRYTYGELAGRVNRFATGLRRLGVRAEERVMLCLLDTLDFPVAFLGCIKAGIVPVAANTLLTPSDYEYMLRDSGATAVVVSAALLPQFAAIPGRVASLARVVVSGGDAGVHIPFDQVLADGDPEFEPADTRADAVCFWMYSSGSTGAPKGTVHVHGSLIRIAEYYARPILGIREDDVVFSAAKLFFAYGLGNAMVFPMAVGATAVLMAERPTPASVALRLRTHQPTIFCAVPTLYASMLVSPDLPSRTELRLRVATSAGEARPPEIGRRVSEHFGIDVLDGIGSTEMLHIFLSNRPGDVRFGTTGKPVPGYELRLVDEAGNPVPDGEQGELQISGETSALCYWNNRARSRSTFLGTWTRSGDKYLRDPDGYYVYCGRSDDMLKVSGIYVSPVEVEAALITHPAVLEAAVIGRADADELIKPKAFVVLKPGHAPSEELADALKRHVKSTLAPYKYPRWIEFVADLPKTATGKIQRFRLRARDTA